MKVNFTSYYTQELKEMKIEADVLSTTPKRTNTPLSLYVIKTVNAAVFNLCKLFDHLDITGEQVWLRKK